MNDLQQACWSPGCRDSVRKRPLAGLVAALSLLGACREPLSVGRRSVILISLDTVRADHLSPYGYGRDTTPFLSALAQRCTLFERTVAQSASTVPSHRAMLTSRYSSRVGQADPYLAEALAGAGYETAAFTGAGGVSKELGFARGFSTWSEATHHHRTFDESIPAISEWLDHRAAERPAFLFVHTYDPHHPYDPPPPYDEMFYPEYSGPITGPATLQLLSKLARVPPNEDYRGYIPLTQEDREKVAALYDGQLRYVDDRLRELFEVLNRQRFLDQSLLVVTSDHGEEFWEHGGLLHSHTVHEELLHVPLMICPPSAQGARRRTAQIVRHIDLGPTILDLVGVPAPASFRGRSLRPVLESGADLGLVGVAELNWFKTIVDGRWKLWVDQRDRRLVLFDLENDPGERSDVFTRHPQRALALYKALAGELEAGMNLAVTALDAEEVNSTSLRQQLRALGYL